MPRQPRYLGHRLIRSLRCNSSSSSHFIECASNYSCRSDINANTVVYILHLQAHASSSAPTPTTGLSLAEYHLITHPVIIPSDTNAMPPTCVDDKAVFTSHQTLLPDANAPILDSNCDAPWSCYLSFQTAAMLAVPFAVLVILHVWQAVAYRKVCKRILPPFRLF